MSGELTLGARYLGGGRCRFRVWAPKAERVDLRVTSPAERWAPMTPLERGYHEVMLEDVPPGALYYYRLDGRTERPDPASRHQPQGVHGASSVVDPSYPWSDGAWRGMPLDEYVLYELHVGAFSAEESFEGVIPHLEELKALGVTALELMPVAQFPGRRNWGYDGVYPFAVHDSYGGPAGLKKLVDACHGRGLAVVLDVVYNHLGPEGNYLDDFGPYFTGRYRTPWGPAINFDGGGSDEVRNFFIENALFWKKEYHIDALRLDAVHAIVDTSAYPFLRELSDRAGRKIHLIAESDDNDVRLVLPVEKGGFDLAAQWNDDLHHALHALLTRESTGYYQDFGDLEHLEKAFREGFVYSGQPSAYRNRRHGSSSRAVDSNRFIVFAQNHDQVGNRVLGDRLAAQVSLEMLKLAAGTVLLSPFLPLLFMGEEYGETAPFFYFTDHSDPQLVEAVRRGRVAEFAAFRWKGEPPDPQSEETFRRSKLQRQRNIPLYSFHKELLRLRKEIPELSRPTKKGLHVDRQDSILLVRRGEDVLVIHHFGDSHADFQVPEGVWRVRLDSAAERWGGPGTRIAIEVTGGEDRSVTLTPHSIVLLQEMEGSRSA